MVRYHTVLIAAAAVAVGVAAALLSAGGPSPNSHGNAHRSQPAPAPIYSHFPSMTSGDCTTIEDCPSAPTFPTAAAGMPDNFYVSSTRAIDVYSRSPFTRSHIWWYTFPSRANANQRGKTNCAYYMAITQATSCDGPIVSDALLVHGGPNCSQVVVAKGNPNSYLVNIRTTGPHSAQEAWYDAYIDPLTPAQKKAIYGVFFDGFDIYDVTPEPCGYGPLPKVESQPTPAARHAVPTAPPVGWHLAVSIPFLDSVVKSVRDNDYRGHAHEMPEYAIMVNGLGGVRNGSDQPDDMIYVLASKRLQYAREEDCFSKKNRSLLGVAGSKPMTSQGQNPHGGWLDKMDDLLLNTQQYHKVVVCQVHMGGQDPADTGPVAGDGISATGGIEARTYAFASFLMAAQPQYDIYWPITCENYGGPATFTTGPGGQDPPGNCGQGHHSMNRAQTYPEMGFTCYTPRYWGGDEVGYGASTSHRIGNWPLDVGAPSTGYGLNVPPEEMSPANNNVYAMEYKSCYWYKYGGSPPVHVGSAAIVVYTSAREPNTRLAPSANYWLHHYLSASQCPHCYRMGLTGADINNGGKMVTVPGVGSTGLVGPYFDNPSANPDGLPLSAQIIVDPSG